MWLALLACVDKAVDDTVVEADSDPSVEETTDTEDSLDADGDGYPADEDCDDGDDDVHPSAEEVWYDGTDQDCSGDDDFDADGDGHRHLDHEGDDCDDADPTAYPGATETVCDGVDQDCDGLDGEDADGDGAVPAACGGDDCDDSDPWIGPHMDEACDEVDHDCDGEPLAEGVCGEPQDALTLASLTVTGDPDWENQYFDRGTTFAGDLDADGAAEILTQCSACELNKGISAYGYLVLDGGVSGRDLVYTELDYDSIQDLGWEPEYHIDPDDGIDFDGDGVDDLVMAAAVASSYQLGVAHVVLGPTDDWNDHFDLYDSHFRWYIEKDEGAPYPPPYVLGDVNDDGRDDFLLYQGERKEGGADQVRLVLGREDAGQRTQDIQDAPAIGVYDPYNEVHAVGGFDGDGVPDLAEGVDYGTLFFVSGTDLVTGDGALVDDLAWHGLYAEATCISSLGDWDADGYDDLAIGYAYDDVYTSDGGLVTFVAGAELTSLDSIGEASGRQYGREGQNIGSNCASADITGDGLKEFTFTGASTASDDVAAHQVMLAAAGLPDGVSALAADLEILLSEDRTLFGLGSLSSGDWDGDGDRELLLNDYLGYRVDGPGGFALIDGGDIPWDDPEYW